MGDKKEARGLTVSHQDSPTEMLQLAARPSWLSQRMWWWRARRQQNPLLRRFSATEKLAGSLLGLAFASVVSAAVATMVAVNNLANARAQQDAGTHHQVLATVLGGSPDTANGPSAVGAVPIGYSAQLRWQWEDRTHVGNESVVSALPPGTTTQVWVNDGGGLTTKPWTANETMAAVTTVGAAALVIVAGCTVLAWAVFNRWLVRRRAQLWQVEWEQVAPMWTGRTGIC
jgi:hypothetical protein